MASTCSRLTHTKVQLVELTCFLLPRWRPDDASREVELDGARARMIGPDGRQRP
jgi:hypothetical protein